MEQFITQNANYIFPVLAIWAISWKGVALWKSAKKDSKAWFVVILITNTIGILEILYIFLLSKVDYQKLWGKIKNFFKKLKIKK